MTKYSTRYAIVKCSGEEGLSKAIEDWVSKGYDILSTCWVGNTKIPISGLHIAGQDKDMYVPNFLLILENKDIPYGETSPPDRT